MPLCRPKTREILPIWNNLTDAPSVSSQIHHVDFLDLAARQRGGDSIGNQVELIGILVSLREVLAGHSTALLSLLPLPQQVFVFEQSVYSRRVVSSRATPAVEKQQILRAVHFFVLSWIRLPLSGLRRKKQRKSFLSERSMEEREVNTHTHTHTHTLS